MVIIKNLLPVIAIICAFFLFAACEDNAQSGNTQDSTTSNTPEKYAQYLSKMTSEEDKTTLKKILALLDSKSLDICQVSKELLAISTQARREGEAKFGFGKPETMKYAGKLEEERTAIYCKEKELPDSLSAYIVVFTTRLDCN